jgi:hypothetical protein
MLKNFAQAWSFICGGAVRAAVTRPTLFELGAGRRFDGEHE